MVSPAWRPWLRLPALMYLPACRRSDASVWQLWPSRETVGFQARPRWPTIELHVEPPRTGTALLRHPTGDLPVALAPAAPPRPPPGRRVDDARSSVQAAPQNQRVQLQ